MELIIGGENLPEKVQAAEDNPIITKVRIEGGGSFNTPVILRKTTTFDSSVYSCDYTPENTPKFLARLPEEERYYFRMYPITDYGMFIIANNVLVEGTWRPPTELDDYFTLGKGWDWQDPHLQAVQALTASDLAGLGTTILEPTHANGPQPCIEVFQALGDALTSSHMGRAENIAIIGFHIKGRQQTYDGGVRSTMTFGNAHHSIATYNYLEDTGSIGICFGGSALETNNFANDVVIRRNIFSGVAAANTATVNTENAYIYENYIRRPGHHEPKFGGGVCGHDHETNSWVDHTKNIWIYNNLYDYEEAAFDGVGTAICLQDPYFSEGMGDHRGATYAVNNVIIGGRDDRVHRYMSNGLFLNGLSDCHVSNNYIFRTGQNAIQAYALKNSVVEDNDLESTGGGGNPSVWLTNCQRNMFRRNNYRDRQGLQVNVQAGFLDVCGEGNVYEGNLVNGESLPIVLQEPCP